MTDIYDFSYEFDAMADGEGFVAVIMIFYLIYVLVVMGISIAQYVLYSLGAYTIAKRRGLRHAWFAWVPVVNGYLLGCVSDQYRYVVKGEIKSKRKVLLVLNLRSAGLGPALGQALNAALIIVSAPMVCSNFYVLPLFLWGTMLAAAFKKN